MHKEHRDSCAWAFIRDMEACAHHVILCNHRQDYAHSPQTQPSAASAMLVEVGAGYEIISCMYCARDMAMETQYGGLYFCSRLF